MRERRIAGRYLLTRQLGAGSSGTVYLADDLVLRRAVAVKVASRAGADSDEALRQEFDFLGRLRHPNLPEVYEFGRDPAIGVSFFSMEYVDGIALDGALRLLGPGAAHELLAQALRALGFHHARGLVHGDLKPANVLVSASAERAPRLKLIDRGLSGLAGQGEPGIVRGTPRYSAATVLGGRPPSPSSDLYARGATFLEALGPAAREEGRVPAALLAVLRRLVAEDEHARYQSAEHALRELEPEAGGYEAEGSAVEPLFVGRGGEMARLEARLDELLAGRVGQPLTVLAGEAGIGKSRVADELARRAAQRWVTVCRGRAAAGTPSPWLPVRDVLRHLEILFGQEDPSFAERIGQLLGALERAPDEAEAAAAGGEERLRDEVRRVLGAAARSRPLLLVLEDLQWLDTATSAFLDDVAWRGLDGPVWTLALWRVEAEAARGGPVLPAVDPEAVLRLGRLDPAETRALVASLFEQPAPAEVVLARLVEVTEGHPGFAEAAARAVIEAGAGLSPEDLDRTVYRRLPASRAEALDLRLAALSPEELELARGLAVLARPVTAPFLARFSGLAPAGLRRRLEALVQGAIVRREGQGAAVRYALRSDTLRMRLRDGTPLAAQQTWQWNAMEAWLAADAGSGASAEMVAEHALECGERAAALLHGSLAVRRSLARQDPGAALAWCRRLAQLEPRGEDAQRLAEWEGDARLGLADARGAERAFAQALERLAAGAGGDARCRLLRQRASALVEAGDHEGARELLLDVLASDAAQVPEDRAQAHALLGRVLFALGRVEEAERQVRTGLEALGDGDTPAAAALWNNLGVIAHERSDYERSESCHRRALAIRGQHGDAEGRSRSLTNLGNLALIAGRHVDARRLYEEALALKRRFGNRQTLARSLSNLALLDASLGHFGVAIQRHEEALRHRLSIGDRAGVAFSHRHLAEVWHEKGELEKALAEARTAVRCARDLGLLDRGLCAALTIEASVEATLGRDQQAQALLDEAIPLAREIDCPSDEAMARLTQARLLRWTAPARAVQELERSLPLLRGAAEPPRLIAVLVEQAALSLGRDLDAAEAAGSEAAEIAQGLQDPLLSARVEHVRGEVALRRGRIDEASERLHRAMDWSSALSVPECEWRVAVSLASFHVRQGRSERGILWLRRCLQVFRRVLARVGDAGLAQSYLGARERAAVLKRLEEWLA